jgi:large subunit ribosomal protein L7A
MTIFGMMCCHSKKRLTDMDSADFKAASKVVGAKQTAKAVEKGMAERVFVAADADRRVLKPIIDLCRKNDLPVETVDNMHELGRLCGIQVGAAAVAFLRGQ